jgi:D-alanine transaminase
MGLVYLNGAFLPPAEARVSVMDRGFLFGDGVYEVIPAYSGRPFRLEEHLRRLDNSLAAIRMRPPHTQQEWQNILVRLVANDREADLSLYLQVTRGAAPSRDHAIPADITPCVFAMATPIGPPPGDVTQRGIAAIVRDDIRWERCDIKAITLLANVLLRQEAAEAGAFEAILVRDGLAMEGAASNLFVVREGVLVTPPKGPYLLPGITRDLVLELAARDGIPYREDTITRRELEMAPEVWLTSSTKEVMPVTRLDGRPVGAGAPGPLWRRMDALYQQAKAQLRLGTFESGPRPSPPPGASQ